MQLPLEKTVGVYLAMPYTPRHSRSHGRHRLRTPRAMTVKTAALVPLWRSLANDLVVVFMLHRFADGALKNGGHSPEALRANLAFLRRHRFHLASLTQLLGERGDDALPSGPTVVFTVDDGYAD